MAQAAHASTAIISKTFTLPLTQAYVSESNLPHMHKIVLQTSDKMNLIQLSEKLKEAEGKHLREHEARKTSKRCSRSREER